MVGSTIITIIRFFNLNIFGVSIHSNQSYCKMGAAVVAVPVVVAIVAHNRHRDNTPPPVHHRVQLPTNTQSSRQKWTAAVANNPNINAINGTININNKQAPYDTQDNSIYVKNRLPTSITSLNNREVNNFLESLDICDAEVMFKL